VIQIGSSAGVTKRIVFVLANICIFFPRALTCVEPCWAARQMFRPKVGVEWATFLWNLRFLNMFFGLTVWFFVFFVVLKQWLVLVMVRMSCMNSSGRLVRDHWWMFLVLARECSIFHKATWSKWVWQLEEIFCSYFVCNCVIVKF